MHILHGTDQDPIIAGYSACFGGDSRHCGSDDNPYSYIAGTFGLRCEDMVRARQQHTDHIRVVGRSNGGEGVVRPGPEGGCDAIITGTTDLMLCILTADCVPIYLYDEIAGVVGIAHSGRIGTMLEIGYKTALKMQNEFDSRPENINCIFGPYICAQHYEVNEEDVSGFHDRFSDEECSRFLSSRDEHFYIDMGTAIRLSMSRAGILEANTKDVNICTYENRALPSWRRDHDQDSYILSFIAMRKNHGNI